MVPFRTKYKPPPLAVVIDCETQILKVKRIKICKSNNPAKGGGFHTRDDSVN
jgi:hypothetical protein